MFYKIWKFSLIFIFLTVLIHFLKDITQDIFGLATILDKFGNIEEDISYFPIWLTWLYHWAWVNAFFSEIATILIIPLKIKEKIFTKKDLMIAACLVYLISMMMIAYFLQ